ncbi:MAG: hypothetical protein JXQ65_04195 [Candidatus Marinimicrobia bacterium]|nr:hypothetical protein [Candidatus Neomarinimicrobiota bacterium]
MDSGMSLALSIVVGSVFLLTVMAAQDNLHRLSVGNELESIVQSNTDHIKDVLTFDITRIGQNVDPDFFLGTIIADIDTSRIAFFSDVDDDGDIDSVRIWLGAKTELNYTENPNDRPIYRQVNSETPLMFGEGVTYFEIKGIKQDLSEANLAELDLIRAIEIKLIVQLGYSYGTWYNPVSGAVEPRFFQSEWKNIICPDNLGWY